MKFLLLDVGSGRTYKGAPNTIVKGPVAGDIPSRLALLPESVNEKTDYNAIFVLVRKAVKKVIGRERVGLGLALADLPSQLGAYWEVGGNYIVMNRNLVNALKTSRIPTREINSFVFVILMHEYLHSLGVLDEYKARSLTAKICMSIFDEKHPAYELSTRDPWQVYPFLAYTPNGRNQYMEFVENFDSDTVSYIM